jgi:23S rRNA pseudouridine2605 synthase
MAGGLVEHDRPMGDAPALGIRSPEHQPPDPSVADRPRAHGARLQRHVQPKPGQTVIAALFRRHANGADLSVGGGIVQADRGVASDGDDLARRRIEHNRAHGGLSGQSSRLRSVKGDAHGGEVMVDHTYHPKPDALSGQSSIDDEAPDQGGERVAKALARAGVASRREVERLIAEGRVALNGEILNTPAVKVGPGDILTVNGEVVSDAEPTRLWRYHKPIGLLTSHADPKGRPTVFDNLPDGLPRVISVGRLDIASEGLLLLTNDGELARALELPTTGLVRRYRARAYGHTDQDKLDKLKNGITVEGVIYGSIEAKLDKAQYKADADRKGPANLWITVTLSEGKNREVRRVLEAIGLQVNRLIRLSYGPFALGTLVQGAAEEVGPRVIRELLADYIAPENLPKGDRIAAPLKPSSPGGGARGLARRAPNPDRATAERPLVTEPTDGKTVYKPGWAKPKKRPAITRGKRPTRPRGEKASAPKIEPKVANPKSQGADSGGSLPLGPRASGALDKAARTETPFRRASGPGTTPAKPARAAHAAGKRVEQDADKGSRKSIDRTVDKARGGYRATIKGPRPAKRTPAKPPGGGPRR